MQGEVGEVGASRSTSRSTSRVQGEEEEDEEEKKEEEEKVEDERPLDRFDPNWWKEGEGG